MIADSLRRGGKSATQRSPRRSSFLYGATGWSPVGIEALIIGIPSFSTVASSGKLFAFAGRPAGRAVHLEEAASMILLPRVSRVPLEERLIQCAGG